MEKMKIISIGDEMSVLLFYLVIPATSKHNPHISYTLS